jgi:RimJ/RimL family protein N-acetyltransferase/catechol 2,3-dioxygenase-like lactoylglutathione lyase family enzyme
MPPLSRPDPNEACGASRGEVVPTRLTGPSLEAPGSPVAYDVLRGTPSAVLEPSPPTSVRLILYVRDQERARAFYEAALGFAPCLHVPGMTEFALPGGARLGLMPEAGIRRLLPSLPDPALARGGPRAETYLVVASPSEALDRALAAGATALSPVQPRDWGDDAGYCLDPDGHVLAFAAPTPAKPAVALRRFDPERDLEVVSAWVERPDVRRWWGDPGVALAELSDREPGTAAIVAWDGRPVGVLCWQTPTRAELEDAGLADLPVDLVDVDVLVGEPAARGRGVAAEALRLLCARLQDDGVRQVGLGTALANAAALSAYAKAGFVPYRDFVENGEGYRYFTRDLTDTRG